MASTIEIGISEQVRFFGALMGTTGLSQANNDVCNNYVNRLLVALDPFVKDNEDEAAETIKEREENLKRIKEEETSKIVAPTSYDMNSLKIK